MVADTNTQTEAAGDAAKAQANAVAETTKAAANAGEQTAKTAGKSATKAVRKTAAAARKSTKTTRKPAAKTRRKAKAATAKKAQPARNERNDAVNYDRTNLFAGFSAFPGTAAFEKFFTEAAGRGEEAAKRSRKAAEEMADMYRANIDAFVESSRIAATGAQSIGQSLIAKGRDSVEETANTVRSFAEAKSPTELLQLQSEYARSTFDRLVEDSSNMTESLVKLAGEAFQPLSNRASANVERFNDIAA